MTDRPNTAPSTTPVVSLNGSAELGLPAVVGHREASRGPHRRLSLAKRARAVLRFAAPILLAYTAACGREEGAATERQASRAEAAEGGPTLAKSEGGEAGEALKEKPGAGRVSLTEAAFATAKIVVEQARLETVLDAPGGLDVPGQVEFDPARVALISPRASGRLERLLAVPGDRVNAGQTVALVLSPAYTAAQNDLLQAKRRAELLANSPDAEGARALLDAARRRLTLAGGSVGEIRRLEAGGQPSEFLAVPSPFAGSIVEASALAGQAVEAGTPLFRIADVSVVNVAADVPERALGALRIGLGATIHLASAPQDVFSGRVTRISEQLDPQTRTAEALVQVSNRARRLKPGMSATVTLRTGGAGSEAGGKALTVPASAVITDGAARYVFVEVGLRSYERRAVELAPGAIAGAGPAGARVAVVSGLAAGERIVSRGAFTLKSELAKASLVDED